MSQKMTEKAHQAPIFREKREKQRVESQGVAKGQEVSCGLPWSPSRCALLAEPLRVRYILYLG